ncbi:MAG TPA: biotin-dependent carboxyltransferase family protein [Candidatus Mcinerneyibacterium sp.]|nr:biotin-dependent carboxyltransferase family protein [Candidatus Mcinerneyibacterium sp.]
MGKIKIINKGLLTLIEDLGRSGYQKFGVPVSGVMDEYSHKIANILVGNDISEATLEVNMLGPKIQFLSDAIIAITGGNLQPLINNEYIEMWKSKKVSDGDILSFKGMKNGMRSYIAFSGGLNVKKVMQSKSFYSRAGIGTEIVNGGIIEINGSKKNYLDNKIDDSYIPEITNSTNLRVVLGPQNDYFTSKGIETFLNSSYEITNNSDRMGYRLKGEKIEHKKSADIISDGLGKGAVQIPGTGQPIIMMSDSQTTGGYTKIGYVIKKDLDKLAQMKPGGKVRFTKISMSKAQKVYIEYLREIEKFKKNCCRNKSFFENILEIIKNIF